MKKLFVSVLAIAGLVACTQETTLVQKGNAPMEFGGAFVENATRADSAVDPSTTTASLTGFDVWGFMDSPAGVVFEDEDVTGEQGNFTYVNTQYWVPGHDYYFAALAPMNSDNWDLDTAKANTFGAGEVSFKNVDGTEDLLYAATTVSTQDIKVGEAPVDKVKFQFSHLLSKVNFSFTNGFDNDNAYIDVKNVQMVVPQDATINLAVENWWDNYEDWTLVGAEETTLSFGDACAMTAPGVKQEVAEERFTIPASAEQKYIITFDVALYFGNVKAFENTVTSEVTGVALEMGRAYNFNATISAENISEDGKELLPIVFDVEKVNEWEENTANTAEAEFRAAMQFGGQVTLANDVVLSSPVVVAQNTILNLNGKTLTNAVDNKATDVLIVAEGATLTIEGDGVIEAVSGNDGYAVIAEGAVVINGGTIKSGVDANGEPNAVVYARGNGEVYVNGGYFPNDNVSKYVLNKKDSDRATTTIEVRGGKFENFDPANNAAENPGTNFVADGYNSNEVEAGVYVVSDALVVADAAAFAAALKSEAKNINVVLYKDLDVAISSLGQQTGGSGEYKLGGVDTETITIDLNGNKLNITTTYWSNLGAKNDNALFTIKNGTMTSSQPTGTWNSYDLTFSNCDYVFENVVFEKAIAFAATGKSVSLKDVTINETHDYYAMWICAEGLNVTADNLTIESLGRGIKIDEQYIDAPAKVTLTVKNSKFTTAKKAAIIVKSAAGAEINVENLDITGVAADKVNAVWVDEDSAAYFDLVTVNGATKIQE